MEDTRSRWAETNTIITQKQDGDDEKTSAKRMSEMIHPQHKVSH